MIHTTNSTTHTRLYLAARKYSSAAGKRNSSRPEGERPMKKIAIIAGLAALLAAGPALTDEFTDRAMKEQQVSGELSKLLPPITQDALDEILIAAEQKYPDVRQLALRELFILSAIRFAQLSAATKAAKERAEKRP